MWSEEFQILHIPSERIHGRTYECKESLLKVREKKYKGKHDGAQVEAASWESIFCPSDAFKSYDNLY
jgi:hypothetical protein